MVIAQDTEYVFLDEPTNNLDIYHASNMMKMVRKLSDEAGKNSDPCASLRLIMQPFIQIISVHLKRKNTRNMEPLKKSFKKKDPF